MILRILVKDRAYLETVLERFGPDAFRSPWYSEILHAMIEAGPDGHVDEIAHFLAEGAIGVLNNLTNLPDALPDVDVNLQASLTKLRIREIDTRSAELDALMLGASDDFKNAAIAEKVRLRDEKQALGGRSNKKFTRREGRG